MNKKNELIKNTSIIGIGTIFRQFISLMLLPLYTHYISPSQLGTVDLIFTYVSLLIPLITIQMEMALFRFLIDSREHVQDTGKVISTSICISSLFLGVSLALILLLNLYIKIPYLSLILAYCLASFFSGLFMQIARGTGENSTFAKANILAGFVSLVSTIILVAILKMGIQGILVSLILTNIFSAAFIFFALSLSSHINLKNIDYGFAKRMVKYSAPLTPTGLSWWAISVSDRTLIAIFIGLAANGLYSVSAKYTIIFTGLFGVFYLAFTESVAKHINSDDINDFISDSFNTVVRMFGSLGLIMIAITPIIFVTFFGVEYSGARQYVPILIVGALLSSVVSMMGSVYIALKKTKDVAVISLTAATLNIVLTVVLLPYIGIYGAAIATVIAYLVVLLQRNHDIKKYISISYDYIALAKITSAYILSLTFFYLPIQTLDMLNIIFVFIFVTLLNIADINKIMRKLTKTTERSRK